MIEFFKEPNIDWMGKAKYFYGLSAILLIAGLISWLHEGGLRYGIDFRGGTNVDVRFAQPPNIDQIRNALKTQGLGNSEIQAVSSGITAANSNEVLIFVEQKGQSDQASDASKARVLTALGAMYGVKDSTKPDFNSATPSSLTDVLTATDPLHLSTSAGDRYDQLARRLLSYRDTTKNGVLTNFDDLSGVEGANSGGHLGAQKQLRHRKLHGSRCRNRRSQGRRRTAQASHLRYPLCTSRHARLHRVPLRMGFRRGRRSRRLSRCPHYIGFFLDFALRNFAYRYRRAPHVSWIFDE